METITSRDNALLRRFRAVRDGKVEEAIFVEGLRLCAEAYLSGLSIEAVIYSDELGQKDKAKRILTELGSVCERVVPVSEALLATISYTKTPQGLVLLASRPEVDENEFKRRQLSNPLLIVMHGINNPVNVGAIMRTAEAAGATGAITTVNSSDPFSPKALRGAMGSAFRLPIWTKTDYGEVLAWCAASGIKTVCADAQASIAYTEMDWTGAKAIVVGPESTGLTPDEVAAAGAVVRIPMHGQVESLNVGVAASILLYEAARQRG
ncbi:MAG: rRNA methylase [Acidobacteria bacterium]|nr:rRNA methylase [Acidobacteriota bacterium]